jgi:hypothetical protein
MRQPARHVVWFVVAGLAALLGCTGPSGQRVSGAEYQELERERSGLAAEGEAEGGGAREERRRELDARSRELAGRREDAAHDAAEQLATRLRLDLDHASALAEEHLELARAQRELAMAQDDLGHFEREGRQRRLDASALELQAAKDDLLETREELAQLELMYGASQLGDATAEIVVQRTKRRLLLSELQHGLAERAARELAERTLPREHELLNAEVIEKQVALSNLQRRIERQAMERAAALRALEHEVRVTAREQRELEELQRLLDNDRQELERSASGRSAGTLP